MATIVLCAQCKKECVPSMYTPGYGIDERDRKLCYACCAEVDRADMAKTGRATLYLTFDTVPPSPASSTPRAFVGNWPGTLSFPVIRLKTGRHNLTGKRYDVWFVDDPGNVWHGVTYGDGTQICHCRRRAA